MNRSFIFTLDLSREYRNLKCFLYLGNANCEIDFGDGTKEHFKYISNFVVCHEYEKAGVYDISINGYCKNIKFNKSITRTRLVDIKQWGEVEGMTDWSGAFIGSTSLIKISATDSPILEKCNNMFRNCLYLKSVNNLNNWNLLTTTDISGMFDTCLDFNSDISKWNVSNIINMTSTFHNCKNFNSDISNWNVINVNYIYNTFINCNKFKADLSNWNLINLKSYEKNHIGINLPLHKMPKIVLLNKL